MLQSHVAAGLTNHLVTNSAQTHELGDLPLCHAVTSSGLNRNQFVFDVVKLNQSGMNFLIFKMKRHRLQNVGSKLVPGLGFGENTVAEGSGVVAPFVRVANFEDQLHYLRIQDERRYNRGSNARRRRCPRKI